jgi:GT2 family glycosyltransferase
MKWRWPRRRGGGASAAVAPPTGQAQNRPRAHWLGWDGRTLRWRVETPEPVAYELRLDGVVFQRFEGREPDCREGHGRPGAATFDYSPTGNDTLELSIASSAEQMPLAPPWRIRFGVAATLGIDQWTQAARFLAPLAGTPQLPQCAWTDLPEIAIVVPIYNAAACVQRCLDALERWTPRSVHWILVDDGSSEPAIAGLLAQHAQRSAVSVERHGHNRGYTRAVNTGIVAAGNADVVLLNSDTEVGPRWLESLRLAAYGDDAIGTVTAVSDNAGAFSVPELEQYCPTPSRWDLASAQRAVLQQAGLRFPELPTGNGFCLYVKRAVIDRIGVMDAEAFPSGYGEENDFCQRAIAAGYRNVIAGNALVRHERSASFGDARRAALGAQGMAVLRARYPHYEEDVAATLHSFDRRVLDYRIRRTWADSDGRYAAAPPRKRLLVVAPNESANAAPPSAIVSDCEVFVIAETRDGHLRWVAPDGNTLEIAQTAAAADERMRSLLVSLAIEAVDASAPGELSVRMASIAGSVGIPMLAPSARR